MSVRERDRSEALARGLGWFSIALGVAQVAAPRTLNRLIGVNPTEATKTLMRAIGARELAAGVGILTRGAPAGFLWARVAGDALDLGLLGNALASDTEKGRAGMAVAAVAGVTALDVVAATRRPASGAGTAADHRQTTERGPMEGRTAITVNASPDDLYARWHDFESLPTFMYHLESVRTTGEGRSHWVAKAPAGTTVEWDAEVTEDVPGKTIAWRSVEGASVENSGSVRFEPAPGGRGTELRVVVRYSPPGGALGSVVAKLFGEEPNQQISDDLRRFKQVVETGEIARSDGSPLGTRTRNIAHQEDAHPAEVNA